MTDTDEYPLRTLYFYLTQECNLACRHCWIDPEYRNARTASSFIPLSLLASIVDQAMPLGLSAIKLTGGEPLLHPGIMEILAIARDRHLTVTVETNGTLVTRSFAESLGRCENPFISVSLDGADAVTHEWVRGVRGSYDKVIDGIRTLAESGLRPQVIMSLFRRNAEQIEELVTMVEALGAGSVKFNIVQPSARGRRIYEDGEGLEIAEIIRIGDRVGNTLAEKFSIPLLFSTPPVFQPLGALFGNGRCGCGQCGIRSILGVLGSGSYALCGIGETVPEMVFGHASTDPLDKVWRTHPVLVEIRDGIPSRLKGVCRSCALRGICLGSCLADNFSQTGDLWAPFWFCARADEAGLFPKGRSLPRSE